MSPVNDWVVVELTSRGEEEDPDVLLKAIKRLIKCEIFLPLSVSKVGETRVVHRLVDGYIFLRRTEPDRAYFNLEETRYIGSILTTRENERGRGSRKIATVPHRDIEKMQKQIVVETAQGIEMDDEVLITDGPYSGITGRVIEEIREMDSVQVHIKLRSKEAILTLPRSFLKFTSKGNVTSFSPFETKVSRIRDWVSKVSPILTWNPPSIGTVFQGWRSLLRLSKWVQTQEGFVRRIRLERWDPPVDEIHMAYSSLARLEHWRCQAKSLFEQARLLDHGPTMAPIETKQGEVTWLQQVLSRIQKITTEVEAIERRLSTRSPDMIQNVVVDGHNLAYRCFHAMNAPGAKVLTDKQGRPTSIIHGVLKSLGALQKKFPGAQIYVCWDGSSQRRKSLCAEYKANRAERSLDTFQMDYLKETLPSLGVAQAYHPEEEADDVIAGLIRGRLAGQNNVMLSTDHDFMQLVTRTDILMTPKVGPKQEVLYDPDKVVSEYGVDPSKMVHLRAMLGDTSDNLKGIPRVPTKVLASLVNAHGSVEAIYASGLSGVTSNQYDKIRAFEKQVRLNVELMALRTDLPFQITEPQPDPEEASRRLTDLDIQAEPITKVFFREMKGFEKRS